MNRLLCVLAVLTGVPVFAADPLPETVLERLIELKVDVAFQRTALQDALHFTGKSMQVEIVIDGDALKAAGWTKNMAVTLTLSQVSPERVLGEILKRYDGPNERMVMCVDEEAKKILITTKSAAEQAQRWIYQFPQPQAE